MAENQRSLLNPFWLLPKIHLILLSHLHKANTLVCIVYKYALSDIPLVYDDIRQLVYTAQAKYTFYSNYTSQER